MPSSTRFAAMEVHAKDWIAQFEAGERRRTGIHSLKVRYNRVFGYYIEVTSSQFEIGARRLHAQADLGQWRALYHAGAKGV